MNIAEEELPDVQSRYIISNIRKSEEGLALKIISETHPQGAEAERQVN